MQFAKILKPFEEMNTGRHDLAELAACHREVVISLSCDEKKLVTAFEKYDGKAENHDGKALKKAFEELLGPDDEPKTKEASLQLTGLTISLNDYPETFRTLFGERKVRQPQPPTTRLRIFGPLEARLMHCDRVILGGLVEGIWPPQPRIDPWLSRPMRHELKLDLPERRIGLNAHDFAQMLGTDEVILSHAAKVGGAPAVASRFLHRLEAVMDKARWADVKKRGEKYIHYAGELDRPKTR